MKIDGVIIFYNSINVDSFIIKEFYGKIKSKCQCLRPIDITNRREISIFKSNINKIDIGSNILLINFGGDGSLFSSLSLTAESLKTPNIYTISFNFGNKGFYCFYPKSLIEQFLNNEIDLLEKVTMDYEEKNFVDGFFWTVNDQYYFVGDVVIKPYIHYKTIKLSYSINSVNLEEIGDGIIVFTPFGSTGYFLSINGIYIDTNFKDLIGVCFIAPHSLKYRPQLIKGQDILISNKDKKNAILLTDGQDKLILEPQQSITIKKTENKFTLIGNKNILQKWVEEFYER
ncbi:MAG: hypothetical protein RMJ51_04100 [Candidatus Calescibacterium sp.]|nr:hypothetical protein [Candidatus Calescibacterium sp.]MDW8195403.1 hypothetical protein [Candidatus Calescibacterium sp.]